MLISQGKVACPPARIRLEAKLVADLLCGLAGKVLEPGRERQVLRDG